jgi:hypothetical protein
MMMFAAYRAADGGDYQPLRTSCKNTFRPVRY